MIFKHFRYFQSFKSVPKKSAENHAPYMKVQKWKETWDHVVPIIMANVEAKNLVISWNFQLFKHVFLSRCSTLQSRLKLSKWVTFNDFQTFSIFSEFQKRAEKIGRKPCPLYEGSKMKGNVRSCCPHMIEQTDRGEVFPRIWADFLKFMWFFSSFSESSFCKILECFMNFDEFFSLHYRRIFEFFLQERLKPNEIY